MSSSTSATVAESGRPLRWWTAFGPGAIIASLTIGTGELVFSSRGGALFGYRILFLFTGICLLKWALLYAQSRHMVLTGVHPFRRWLDFPVGPRGWFLGVLFVFAVLCIPVWVSFHASVIGDLLAGLTNTKGWAQGAAVHLWGMLVLTGMLLLAFRGGYQALERTQLVVVAALLGAVGVSLWLLQPNWLQLLGSFFIPRPLELPAWVAQSPDPMVAQIATRPLWMELSLYVGVVGGASYDYLAYVSFLREKRWGAASPHDSAPMEINLAARHLAAPLTDSILSFLVVLAFSAAFVASGWLLLAPAQSLPGDGNFLELQARFVTHVHPWLYPLYVSGALLAMIGTLYGTIEVAPVMLQETGRLFTTVPTDKALRTWRRVALGWVGGGALLILAISFALQYLSGTQRPPGLTTLLLPANLFTGVLSCGLVCLFNLWMDRFLPAGYRNGWILTCLNALAACVFVFLGIKGYWDFGTRYAQYGGWLAIGLLLATIAAGGGLAWFVQERLPRGDGAVGRRD